MKTTKLKWTSTSTALPLHMQEVFIKCNDGYHVAMYDADKAGFKLKGGAFLTDNDCEIHWIAITPP